jgi:anti-sigma factor RsiW
MSIDPTESMPAMDCAELERSLDAWVDGELDAREEVEAERHVAGCDRCRVEAERSRRVRLSLRAKLHEAMDPAMTPAPDALRQRIHVALVQERRPLWRRALAPLPLGAMAACAAGVLVVLATQGGTDPLVDEAVRKHTRDLPLEVTAASLGPDSVARWFTGKLDFNAAPPRFGAGGVRLVGARLSNIQDRPAAYVRYELPRGQLGLFILDDPHRRFGVAGRTVQIGPATVRLVNARGYTVAVWRRDQIVYSLVSDLEEADLARLVETVQGLSGR